MSHLISFTDRVSFASSNEIPGFCGNIFFLSSEFFLDKEKQAFNVKYALTIVLARCRGGTATSTAYQNAPTLLLMRTGWPQYCRSSAIGRVYFVATHGRDSIAPTYAARNTVMSGCATDPSSHCRDSIAPTYAARNTVMSGRAAAASSAVRRIWD